jgi:hypothetical protein
MEEAERRALAGSSWICSGLNLMVPLAFFDILGVHKSLLLSLQDSNHILHTIQEIGHLRALPYSSPGP